jgi:hypothetical protein
MSLLERNQISRTQWRVLELIERRRDPSWWARYDAVCQRVPPVPVGPDLFDFEPCIRAVAREFGWDEDATVQSMERDLDRFTSRKTDG